PQHHTSSPYTTLFRSHSGEEGEHEEAAGGRAVTEEAAPPAALGGEPPCLAHRREGHGDGPEQGEPGPHVHPSPVRMRGSAAAYRDRKSTRLNSSHGSI